MTYRFGRNAIREDYAEQKAFNQRVPNLFKRGDDIAAKLTSTKVAIFVEREGVWHTYRSHPDFVPAPVPVLACNQKDPRDFISARQSDEKQGGPTHSSPPIRYQTLTDLPPLVTLPPLQSTPKRPYRVTKRGKTQRPRGYFDSPTCEESTDKFQ